jgi:peptidoglycan/LPS O-acetylase OafA/YrhL
MASSDADEQDKRRDQRALGELRVWAAQHRDYRLQRQIWYAALGVAFGCAAFGYRRPVINVHGLNVRWPVAAVGLIAACAATFQGFWIMPSRPPRASGSQKRHLINQNQGLVPPANEADVREAIETTR